MKLYKYREFNQFLIKGICGSEIYFSDPKKFNDPLDCSPIVINDLELNDLEKLCCAMIVKNDSASKPSELLNNFKYDCQECDDIDQQKASYTYQIENEIKKQLDLIMKTKGVLSLSSNVNSPLMWSHYADEHRGISLEYDMDTSVYDRPKEIDYNAPRGISAKLIAEFILRGSEKAGEDIEFQYFFTKANEWKYECEWRSISDASGCNQASFELTGVYFGMRCESSVVASIIKLLHTETSKVKFYQMRPDSLSFELHQHLLEPYERISSIPKQSPILAFRGHEILN